MFADEIVKALNGRWFGKYGTARCPAHDDHTPSLSVSVGIDDKILFHCFAGCSQEQVIDAFRSRRLWPDKGLGILACTAPRNGYKNAELDRDDDNRSQAALAIWQSAKSSQGTLVQTYLASRGVCLPLPDALRFHLGLKHRSGGIWPAMVALVTHGETGLPIAIHRTFLARDGPGKAPVDPAKMMLGPCRGGVVRLAEPGQVLMVGEGIETCLAAMQATSKPAWAALSTSGLRSLNLPPNVRNVIVLADGDEPGETAARNCASRWRREGRYVRIARPPSGMDFNDLLMAHKSTLPEGAP